MKQLNILVIEDNAAVVANIFEFFEGREYVLDAAPNASSGLYLLENNQYDVVILDIMLPDMTGLKVCKTIREKFGRQLPVLMLTAKSTLDDKVDGFQSGADDYLVKPFELLELECRIQSLIKRITVQEDTAILIVGDLQYDTNTLQVTRRGRKLLLNPICRKMLLLLMRHSPNIVTRSKFESEIWGDQIPDKDVLKTHIYKLRSIIDKEFDVKLIKTIPKTGYSISD